MQTDKFKKMTAINYLFKTRQIMPDNFLFKE